jgi:hypothetical protein
MRSLFLIACLAIFAGSAFAEDDAVYMRKRDHGGFHGGFDGFGYGQPFYGGYYYPPVIYGSFYARPSPTHLDYFRLRGTPMPDCPCAEAMPFAQSEIPVE